jgi:hypothetical protein
MSQKPRAANRLQQRERTHRGRVRSGRSGHYWVPRVQYVTDDIQRRVNDRLEKAIATLSQDGPIPLPLGERR